MDTTMSLLPQTSAPESQGNSFLLSIAGIGSSAEGDLSERDEEILAAEIDPVYGWTLTNHSNDFELLPEKL